MGEHRLRLLRVPGMRERMEHWSAATPAETSELFQERVAQLRCWVVSQKRLPEYGEGDGEERRLGSWLNHQRRHLQTSSNDGRWRLGFLQASGIPGLPARIEMWRKPRCAFEVRLAELEAWIASHGGWCPKIGAGDAEERRQGNFLRKQQNVFKQGKLEAERFEKLAAVPALRGTVE